MDVCTAARMDKEGKWLKTRDLIWRNDKSIRRKCMIRAVIHGLEVENMGQGFPT